MAEKSQTQKVKAQVDLTYDGGVARKGDVVDLPAQTPRDRAYIARLADLNVIEVVIDKAEQEHPRRRRKS